MNTETDTDIRLMTIVSQSHTVETDFLSRVHAVVVNKIKSLARVTKYPMNKICGKEFWGQLNRDEQHAARQYMIYLVRTEQVPMEFAGTDYSGNKTFRLK